MNLDKIKLFEMVELEIDATIPGRYFFTTQPQLRNQADQIIVIRGLQVYAAASYSFSHTSPSVPGLAQTDIPKATLTLYVNGMEAVKGVPLANFINVNSGIFQQEIQGLDNLNNVDWAKSYVEFATAPSQQCVIPFGVSYFKAVRSATDPNKWVSVD